MCPDRLKTLGIRQGQISFSCFFGVRNILLLSRSPAPTQRHGPVVRTNVLWSDWWQSKTFCSSSLLSLKLKLGTVSQRPVVSVCSRDPLIRTWCFFKMATVFTRDPKHCTHQAKAGSSMTLCGIMLSSYPEAQMLRFFPQPK